MASKIEQSEFRPMIEKWIAEGLAYQEIEGRCKAELGLAVSHMTIKRHADSNPNLVAARAASMAATQNGLTADDLDAMADDASMTIDVSGIPTEPDKVRAFTREALARIYLNQLLIVEHRQKAFMQGKGRYPQNEIGGLKAILSCLGYITEDKDKALDHEKISEATTP